MNAATSLGVAGRESDGLLGSMISSQLLPPHALIVRSPQLLERHQRVSPQNQFEIPLRHQSVVIV